MRLIASLIVRNEAHRYLWLNLQHLLDFCDEVRVVDDGSTDDTPDVLSSLDRVKTLRTAPGFYTHEGQARQQLLDWTLKGKPTHVLAIDADEFVTDGARVAEACRVSKSRTLKLCMEEVWRVTPEGYRSRQDGGWRSYEGVFVWAVPSNPGSLMIQDRKLASGRIPFRALTRRELGRAGASILHFGWANERERKTRHARYVEHDGGSFHASQHLDSIMWPDEKVMLVDCPLPGGLRDVWPMLAERANR